MVFERVVNNLENLDTKVILVVIKKLMMVIRRDKDFVSKFYKENSMKDRIDYDIEFHNRIKYRILILIIIEIF